MDYATVMATILAFGTIALVVVTAYYAYQTRALVKRETKALDVSLVKDELESAIGPLFTLTIAIRTAFHKTYPTITLDKITEGYSQFLTLRLSREYFDEVILRHPHLIDQQILARWIEEQWNVNKSFEKGDTVTIDVRTETLRWMEDIERQYAVLKKRYDELTQPTKSNR